MEMIPKLSSPKRIAGDSWKLVKTVPKSLVSIRTVIKPSNPVAMTLEPIARLLQQAKVINVTRTDTTIISLFCKINKIDEIYKK